MRLPDYTPARLSLSEFLEDNKRRRGRPKTTWMCIIKKDIEPDQQILLVIDLNDREGTITTLKQATSDRNAWRKTIKYLLMK